MCQETEFKSKGKTTVILQTKYNINCQWHHLMLGFFIPEKDKFINECFWCITSIMFTSNIFSLFPKAVCAIFLLLPSQNQPHNGDSTQQQEKVKRHTICAKNRRVTPTTLKQDNNTHTDKSVLQLCHW
jgi:hypothetical protein